MDPALAYTILSWQMLYPSCAKLLNYPDRGGTQGRTRAGGRPIVAGTFGRRQTYTFTIRKGFRFSPPSNAPVTAQTFKYTIERSLNPKMKSPVSTTDTSRSRRRQGVHEGKAQHVSGIVARGQARPAHRPTPDLVSVIALPFFCAVPVATPSIPRESGHSLGRAVLRRLLYAGQGSTQAKPELPRGPPTPARADRARGRGLAGRGDPEGRSGRGRLRSGRRRAGARSLEARMASGAPPRKRGAGSSSSIPRSASPTSPSTRSVRSSETSDSGRRPTSRSIVEPWLESALPSARTGAPDRPVPAARYARLRRRPGLPVPPSLKGARRLAGAKRRRAVLYTCSAAPCDQIAQIVKGSLARIGIDVQVKSFPSASCSSASDERRALGSGLVRLAGRLPGSCAVPQRRAANGQAGTFDDPEYTRKLEAAARLSGPARYLAYGKLDVDIARTKRHGFPTRTRRTGISSPRGSAARSSCRVQRHGPRRALHPALACRSPRCRRWDSRRRSSTSTCRATSSTRAGSSAG